MNKKMIVVVAVAVILALGSGFLVWKNEKNAAQQEAQNQEQQKNEQEVIDTSDWKTYRNEEFGFEVKYPKNWEVFKNAGINSDPSVISLTSVETQKMFQNKKTDIPCDLSVYYYSSITDEPENYTKATTIEEMINKNRMITKIGSIYSGGKKATDVAWGGNGAYYTILVINNDHLYKISFCKKGNKDELTSVEKNVLETFTFLE